MRVATELLINHLNVNGSNLKPHELTAFSKDDVTRQLARFLLDSEYLTLESDWAEFAHSARLRASLEVMSREQASAVTDLLGALERGYPPEMLTGVLGTVQRVFDPTGYRPARFPLTFEGAPKPDQIWQHFKGTNYVILPSDRSAADESRLIRYYPLNDQGHKAEPDEAPWSRPLREFIEEVMNDDGVWVPRFRRLQ